MYLEHASAFILQKLEVEHVSESRELGEVMRVAFITLNPRDDLRFHVPWRELTDEKRARYNGAAAAVVRAHTGQKLPGSGVA